MPHRLLAALLALLFLAPVASRALPVTKKVLTFANAHTRIAVAYPGTGNKVIDAALAAYARENIAGDHTSADEPKRTAITYRVARNDAHMFAMIFTIDVDLGGTHGQLAFESFNFLLPQGRRIVLSDIVDGQRGIDLVSKLAIADLTQRLTAAGEAVDPHWIAQGAGPQAENFEAFTVSQGALHILFAPYLVAGHSSGTLEAVIPLGQLQDVLRPGWHPH